MAKEYKLIQESDNPLQIEKDLIEIQKTIIYFGKEILQKLTEINKVLQKDNTRTYKADEPIAKYLSQIKIPDGYNGNNSKW